MMEEMVTKEDLKQLRLLLIRDFERIVSKSGHTEKQEPLNREWVKGNWARKLLDVSPGTLQRIRIEGKVSFKKIRGSYYYNKADLLNLFSDK